MTSQSRARTTTLDKGLLLVIRLGCLLVLLTPLVVTPSTLFPYVVGKATYSRALIEIVFVCWAVLALRLPAHRPRRSWVLGLFGIYLFGSLIAALVGVSLQRSFWGDFRRMGGVFDLAHWFAFAVVLASVFKEKREWGWLLNANLGISLVVALLGLAQQQGVRVFSYLITTGRVDITFGNATYVGAYMLVNVFIALAFLAHSFRVVHQPIRRQSRRQRRRRRTEAVALIPPMVLWRIFWITTAALDLWVLTLSGTRGAFLGLFGGLIITGTGYLVWGRRPRMKLLIGTLMAVPFLLAVALPLWRDSLLLQNLARSNVAAERFNRLISLGAKDPSMISRLSAAEAGLQAFIRRPVFGWGPENFAVAFDRYSSGQDVVPELRLADQAHNKLVEELVTKGIVGFISYGLLLGTVAWALIRKLRTDPETQPFTLFLGAGVLAYALQNLFLFDTPGTFLQFVLLLGWVATVEGQLAVQPATAKARSETASSSKPGRERDATQGLGKAIFSAKRVDGTVPAVLLVLLIASLYLFVYRPYHAAQLVPVQSASAMNYLEDARRSFQTFPALATLGRQILFDTLGEQWSLIAKGDESFLLQELQREGEAALRSEPQNARIHLALARIFQQATDQAYRPLARRHLEAAQILAPNLFETLETAIQQEVSEEDYAQALTMIYQYRGTDPVKARAVMDLMNHVQRLLGAQIGAEEYLCRWAPGRALTLEERAKIPCEQKPTS